MTTPDQKPEIIVAADTQQLAKQGAALFERAVLDAVRKRDRAVVAISGGSTPRPMNRLLAQIPHLERIPWQRVHLFWVDERMVPYDDPASNYGAARQDFVGKVPLPDVQVHPMPVDKSPAMAVEMYTRRLKDYFDSQEPAFDLICLGIGTDGHTASLFPEQADLHNGPQWVLSVKGGNPNVRRLTLNYPILNHAAAVVFMVSGKNKAEMVCRLLCDRPQRYPPQKISPQNGSLIWLLDRPAASLLPPQLIE